MPQEEIVRRLIEVQKIASDIEADSRLQAEKLLREARTKREALRQEALRRCALDGEKDLLREKARLESGFERSLSDWEASLRALPQDRQGFRTFVLDTLSKDG